MIVDGKKIAERIKRELKMLAASLAPKTLVIFVVGSDPASARFVERKRVFGDEIGVTVEVKQFPEDVAAEFLISEIKNSAAYANGIVIQLPLPSHLPKQEILNAVPAELDVDLLSDEGAARWASGPSRRLPPVAAAFAEIFKEYHVDLANKNIVVIGAGVLVGKPVSEYLTSLGAAHTVIDKDTPDPTAFMQKADIIISGAGVPGLVRAEHVKEGVVLIDAGTSSASGKLVGDIDQSAYEKASLVSPVPGGVGPITVAALFAHLFKN